MSEPLRPQLFISHRHSDSQIAAALADFIKGTSMDEVDVHLSSKWNYKGPKFGVTLSAELRKALWEANVLILVYTTADQDWSFCMWECGAAITPESPDTSVIVFRCGRDVPAVFAAETTVDVRNLSDIKRFTKQFLTDHTFFAGRGAALRPHSSDESVERASQELFEALQKALPEEAQDEEWPAWPFLRIELSKAEVDKLQQAAPVERVALSHEAVKEHAVVVKSARVAYLFGLSSIEDGEKFGRLLDTWQEAYPTSDATWFDSCCEQIMASVRRLNPIIQWTPLRQVGSATGYTPVLSRVRRVSVGGSVQFDIFFYNLSDPQAVPATSRMTPFPDFFYKNLGQVAPETIKVKDLAREFKARGLDRLLLLNGGLNPIYVIHRRVLGSVILDQMAGEGGSAQAGPITEETTLAEMLSRPEVEKAFENFVTVRRRATLAEARDSMRMKPTCEDVLVTERGAWDEPVLGWLTKADIERDIDRIS